MLREVLSSKKYSVALAPGGFSEAVYTGYRENQEVSFILGRYGFIRIAIEHGVDIIPVYTYGMNSMYKLPDWKRHRRAVLSQKFSVPLLFFYGRGGTAVPLTEETVNVSFDPFPASTYKPEDYKQCHQDYCVYLKKCFDEYKHVSEYTKNSELLFAGREQLPARL